MGWVGPGIAVLKSPLPALLLCALKAAENLHSEGLEKRAAHGAHVLLRFSAQLMLSVPCGHPVRCVPTHGEASPYIWNFLLSSCPPPGAIRALPSAAQPPHICSAKERGLNTLSQ